MVGWRRDGEVELGPHKGGRGLEMAGWTTLNVRFFWMLMPAQVAAVETPPPPLPPAHNEETVSTRRGLCPPRPLTERD